MAKHKSGELRCPATALIYNWAYMTHTKTNYWYIKQAVNIFSVFFLSNHVINSEKSYMHIIEPPRGKTNNMVSEQIRHKPGCTSTEDGQRLESLDLESRGIVLSV